MRMGEILSLLKEYVLFGAMILALFIAGYAIIYKKIMKGTKKISARKFILYGTSICYVVIVIGAVFFSRGGNYGQVNLHLFSSYRQAYNQMQMSLFRNIILNILLFVPLGFLLPFYSDKLKKAYIIIPMGFIATVFIEIIQYIAKIGIFEIDDILNNTIGTCIGYTWFMIYNILRSKENRKRIIIYIVPTLIVICIFLGIYIKYETQEFGNLTFEYNYKVDMKNIKVENKIELTNNTSKKEIYSAQILTKEETKELAKRIFENTESQIDENRTIIYEYEAIYYSNKGQSIWIKYKGGKYDYTDFAIYNAKKENEDGESSFIKPEDIKVRGASKEEIEDALKKIGIEVPENAEFEETKEGQYVFSVDMYKASDKLIDGELRCSYYENGIISNLNNNIITYKIEKQEEIISPNEAYQEIIKGKFMYNEYQMKDIESIIIEDVNINYVLDTKGFYVPVYAFNAKIDNKDETIEIRALR